MAASRTPFASEGEARPSAEIYRFPAQAIAWVREPAGHVAIVDSRGNIRRYRSEGDLHADILARNAAVTRQAETIVAEVRDLSLDDLEQADELFLCNSVYGVWPVRSFASLNWSPGPLTRKLQAIARTLLDA